MKSINEQPQWIKINEISDIPEDNCWLMMSEKDGSTYIDQSLLIYPAQLIYVTHYAPIIPPQPPKED